MAQFYATPPPKTVKCAQWDEVQDKYDPTWSCLWLCMELHHKFGLLCCVYVCLLKCEWTEALLSCNAPMGIDNPKKVVACESFVLQFIRKMSAFMVECAGYG